MIKFIKYKGTDINYSDINGDTAIHYCSETGKISTLQLLVQKGIDIHRTDVDGDNALHIASLNGRLECMTFLIENKADVNCLNHRGETPVAYALVKKHYNAVRILIQNGASIKKDARKSGTSPLLLACKICDYKTLKMILSQKVSYNIIFKESRTMLM